MCCGSLNLIIHLRGIDVQRSVGLVRLSNNFEVTRVRGKQVVRNHVNRVGLSM
jgi:hypothetical protein